MLYRRCRECYGWHNIESRHLFIYCPLNSIYYPLNCRSLAKWWEIKVRPIVPDFISLTHKNPCQRRRHMVWNFYHDHSFLLIRKPSSFTSQIHNLSHPHIWDTRKLVCAKYFWSRMMIKVELFLNKTKHINTDHNFYGDNKQGVKLCIYNIKFNLNFNFGNKLNTHLQFHSIPPNSSQFHSIPPQFPLNS